MMPANQLRFRPRKIEIIIDYANCEPATNNISNPSCGFACVKACRLYGRNILKIEENRPVLAVTEPEEIRRLDNECLACEFHCALSGNSCIHIDVPLQGILEYRNESKREGD